MPPGRKSIRQAEDRAKWRRFGEANVQQWTATTDDDADEKKHYEINKKLTAVLTNSLTAEGFVNQNRHDAVCHDDDDVRDIL